MIASDEYQTPKKYIKAAIEVMGNIDLDPACSDINQDRLRNYIKSHYSEDGLEKVWYGNIWLNPPYSKPNLTIWTRQLIVNRIDYRQLIYLIPSYTSERWYHRCLEHCTSICIPDHRINFLIKSKPQTQPRFANTFFYFGNHPNKFIEKYSQFGKCFKN